MGRLENKVAVITGATSGIGEGSARRFVAEGAKIVLSGRNTAKGKALVEELGDGTIFVRADVGVERDVENLIESAVSRFGRLDCLFNNAGETHLGGMVADVTERDLEWSFRTLVFSVAFGCKHAVKQFRAQGTGGVVLNNASIAGSRTGFGNHLYSAAKAAVIQLTKSYAMEVAPENIRMNTISPGYILTPIFSRVFGAKGEDADRKAQSLYEAFAAVTPLKRTGVPSDIGAMAAFLASDEASFITAQDFVVDSGVSAGRTYSEALAGFGALGEAMGFPPISELV